MPLEDAGRAGRASRRGARYDVGNWAATYLEMLAPEPRRSNGHAAAEEPDAAAEDEARARLRGLYSNLRTFYRATRAAERRVG